MNRIKTIGLLDLEKNISLDLIKSSTKQIYDHIWILIENYVWNRLHLEIKHNINDRINLDLVEMCDE